MRYDAAWSEEVTLPKGQRIRLRLVRPEDKERLRAGFDRLSPESRYLRFFTQKDALSDQELHYLTECDQARHIALGAVALDEHGEEGEGLGVARCIALPDRPDTSEMAVAVVDGMQGQGLGKLLLGRLLEAAGERGVKRLRIEFLERNVAMKSLLGELLRGADLHTEEGVTGIELALPSVPTDVEGRRGNLLYRVLALAAKGLIVVMLRPIIDRLAPPELEPEEPSGTDKELPVGDATIDEDDA